MSGLDHVLRLVDEELALGEARGALNAVAERQFPPATRFALDLAKTGACGAPPPREQWAKTARMLADREEESAASEALGDLSWVLEHGDPETCAAALGATWRAQNPFRRPKEGDPLDVLIPQLEDAPAARALDRAARLKLPPVGLMRRVAELEAEPLENTPTKPFDRGLSLALVAAARADVAALPPPPTFENTYSGLDSFNVDFWFQYNQLPLVSAWTGTADTGGLVPHDLAYRAEQFIASAAQKLEHYGDMVALAHHKVEVAQAAGKPIGAQLERKSLEAFLREQAQVRAEYDYFIRLHEAALSLVRAVEYVHEYSNLAAMLQDTEEEAKEDYDKYKNWYQPPWYEPSGTLSPNEVADLNDRQRLRDTARESADAVERLRSMLPNRYPTEESRKLPWRDSL